MLVRAGFPFNYDQEVESELTGLSCGEPSLTIQSAADEADINTIVRRFNQTGQLPQPIVLPVYQDIDGVFDYQTAMNVIVEANTAFAKLDAKVRARFHNSPEELLQFVEDPDNLPEAERLGITVKRPEELPRGVPNLPLTPGPQPVNPTPSGVQPPPPPAPAQSST